MVRVLDPQTQRPEFSFLELTQMPDECGAHMSGMSTEARWVGGPPIIPASGRQS